MKFKEGVTVKGVMPETVLAMQIIDSIYREEVGEEVLITAIMNGKHMAKSLHYVGYAFDCRTFPYDALQLKKIVAHAKRVLDKEFDIILEPTHLHVEFDPK